MRNRATVVWDSNPFNAYGAEVARVVAGSGVPVVRYCRPNTRYPSAGVRVRAALPRSGEARRGIVGRGRYVAALVRLVVHVTTRRCVCIVPWVAGPDKWAIVLLQMLRTPVVFVAHNPVPERDATLSDPVLARIQRGAARVVVHREDLRTGAYGGPNVRAIPHPAYFAWRAFTATSASDHAEGSHREVLYLGAARVDKGFLTVPDVAAHLETSGAHLTLAVGRVPPGMWEELAQRANVTLVGSGRELLSDHEVRAAMEASDVLIAPYVSVTASGTVLCALTVGLPVVSYQAAGLDGLLSRGWMTPPGDVGALCDLAAGMVLPPGEEMVRRARDQDTLAAAGWRRLLAELGSVGAGDEP